ncbi:PadR family transcriptional regulator [bacterium]|nr:MAG: PadR family transcriptional regulator [bacterium]
MGANATNPMTANLLRGNTAIIVLSVLRDGPTHGYAIASEILVRTQHAIELKQGTLYPLLHELEKDGFISSDWEILPGERPRRVYTLTESGSTELERRLNTWRDFSTAMFRLTGVKADDSAR